MVSQPVMHTEWRMQEGYSTIQSNLFTGSALKIAKLEREIEYSKLLSFFIYKFFLLEYYLTSCCTINVDGILHTRVPE